MHGMILMAAEGGADAASSGGMSAVLDASTELVSFAGTLFNTILANPVLVFFVAAGFVSIGLGIVKKLKRTAR